MTVTLFSDGQPSYIILWLTLIQTCLTMFQLSSQQLGILIMVISFMTNLESTTHFCHYYSNIRKTLLDDFKMINVNILKLSGTALTDLMLYVEA